MLLTFFNNTWTWGPSVNFPENSNVSLTLLHNVTQTSPSCLQGDSLTSLWLVNRPTQVFAPPTEAAAALSASFSRNHMEGPVCHSLEEKHFSVKGSLVWQFYVTAWNHSAEFFFFLLINRKNNLPALSDTWTSKHYIDTRWEKYIYFFKLIL